MIFLLANHMKTVFFWFFLYTSTTALLLSTIDMYYPKFNLTDPLIYMISIFLGLLAGIFTPKLF